ncbi:MAG: hypothetical protein K8R58_13620 [Bacteroidales bacterium]|nr:hypothetical protein [Bacteroidales bacterium]
MKELNIDDIIFKNCNLKGKSKSLLVKNSKFKNSSIKYSKGDLIVENTEFDNSNIVATMGNSKSSIVEIKSGSILMNYDGETAVYIEGYNNYKIDDCTIFYNSKDGIGIFNSGSFRGTNIIIDNIIMNNGLGNNGIGIKLYHSYANIFGDQLIEQNQYGITSLNNSNVSIRGNSQANYTYETQLIRYNSKHQIYATQNSFPFHIKWNGIIDEDNQYPLVYYSSSIYEELDVSDNYWGNNFDPETDLYPASYYNYLPIWELNSGAGSNGAEEMYNSAQDKIAQEDYSGAKADFQQIIFDYPTSKYAQAAMRELFSLEEFENNDYVALKSYYNSNSNIQSNPEFIGLTFQLQKLLSIEKQL